MATNDGGPAFPCYALDAPLDGSGKPGMTLRDWFAGQALAGMLANAEIARAIQQGKIAALSSGMTLEQFTHDIERDATAITAYALADAMLAERTKHDRTVTNLQEPTNDQ